MPLVASDTGNPVYAMKSSGTIVDRMSLVRSCMSLVRSWISQDQRNSAQRGLRCWVMAFLGLLPLAIAFVIPHAAFGSDRSDRAPPSCPGIDHGGNQASDFRLRDSSPTMRWKYDDNWRIHTSKALEAMRRGEYSLQVRTDLDFTLRWWPNHLPALNGLIRYDVAGGKDYEFPPAECYFLEARRLYPDDLAIPIVLGNCYWKRGQLVGAREAYRAAILLDDGSAEAPFEWTSLC